MTDPNETKTANTPEEAVNGFENLDDALAYLTGADQEVVNEEQVQAEPPAAPASPATPPPSPEVNADEDWSKKYEESERARKAAQAKMFETQEKYNRLLEQLAERPKPEAPKAEQPAEEPTVQSEYNEVFKSVYKDLVKKYPDHDEEYVRNMAGSLAFEKFTEAKIKAGVAAALAEAPVTKEFEARTIAQRIQDTDKFYTEVVKPALPDENLHAEFLLGLNHAIDALSKRDGRQYRDARGEWTEALWKAVDVKGLAEEVFTKTYGRAALQGRIAPKGAPEEKAPAAKRTVVPTGTAGMNAVQRDGTGRFVRPKAGAGDGVMSDDDFFKIVAESGR